ncbi:unnamed protein product [Allacma fusca]|uniref:Ig-like domain-containing protein n=1 Tax=Allacma fusca TaxID=39272 RepID=A0A8J2JVM4_9HEXA|nr:unnamed protein product [Allacma fusca]
MVKLTLLERKTVYGRASPLFPRNHDCFSNYPDFLLHLPRAPGWWFFLVFNLLMLSNVSEECPSTCHCRWVGGKESVSCFRAGLTKIPQGLDPGTQVLNISGNALKSLPGYVFLSMNLLNLQKIFLSECELVSLDPHVFSKLTNLVELELSGNRLGLVPSHTFGEIPELRELKVNSNPIPRISNHAFLGLRRLVRLELTNCQLVTIETWAFRELPALEWLRLDNNRLLTVQAESFFPLQSLHGLKINGNPWNCSCSLKPLRNWMLKNNVPFEGIPPICQEPSRLQGKPWDRLELQDFACLPKLQSLAEEERIRRVVEGHNTTFVCRLEATADTHVSWLTGSKGVPLTNGSSWTGGGSVVISESFVWKSEDEEEEGSSMVRSLGFKKSVLTIIRTTPRDTGVYTCRGESRAGSVAANFSLVVLQNKAENMTGRLLFTGTLVAALLTLVVCLLLSCVCLVGRHRQSTVVINHHHDKIELNHINVGQNGGSGLASNNHTLHNHMSNNLSSSNSVRRPPERSRDYKALPTMDPEENESNPAWDHPSLTCSAPPAPIPSTPARPNKHKFFGTEEDATDDNSTRLVSPSSPPTTTSNGSNNKREQGAGRDKFPDLIDEKMSVSSTSDFVSLPRPNRNQDYHRPSYFYRRMNSGSQSPLLSAYHSYGNSVDTHSLNSSESLAYSSALVPPHDHYHPHHHHHLLHEPGSSHAKYKASDRLSMPTSPIHEPHSTTYDYHAAQLAAFLEEYRLLQLELMRMSASLNNTPGSAEGNGNNMTGTPIGPTAPSSSTSSATQNAPQALKAADNNSSQQQLKSILKNPTHNNNYMA